MIIKKMVCEPEINIIIILNKTSWLSKSMVDEPEIDIAASSCNNHSAPLFSLNINIFILTIIFIITYLCKDNKDHTDKDNKDDRYCNNHSFPPFLPRYLHFHCHHGCQHYLSKEGGSWWNISPQLYNTCPLLKRFKRLKHTKCTIAKLMSILQ